MQFPVSGGFNAQTSSNGSFNQSNVTNMGMDSVQAQVITIVLQYSHIVITNLVYNRD